MSEKARSDITEFLLQAAHDKPNCLNHLFTVLYNDLHALARRYLAREAHGHTLQPTALVNEAYLTLVDQERVDWKNRSHFFAVGALAMRRILVNHAIAAKRLKRGGAAIKVELQEGLISTRREEDVLAIDHALLELAKLNQRHAKIVEMRFFGGLTVPETAEALGVSTSTVEKDWRFLSAWLRNALRG